jgi:hypothetical protein
MRRSTYREVTGFYENGRYVMQIVDRYDWGRQPAEARAARALRHRLRDAHCQPDLRPLGRYGLRRRLERRIVPARHVVR